MAQHVFISYASHDRPCAYAICRDLEARNVRCWLAPRDVPLGADYAKSIMEGISEAHAMIVIVSALSNKSVHVPREVERAVSRNIPVLPFRIEAVPLSASLEYFVSSSQWLDASEGRIETHFGEFALAVQRMMRATSAARPGATVDAGVGPRLDRRAATITEKRLKALSARPIDGWRGRVARMFTLAGVLSVLAILGFLSVYIYSLSGRANGHLIDALLRRQVGDDAEKAITPLGAIHLQLASAEGVPVTQDEGTFPDSQLLAAPNLAWSTILGSGGNPGASEAPIEARIYGPAGLQVAAGGVRRLTKTANGDESIAGVIPISESLVREPGLYKFSLYSGDREIATRSFLISTDLVARARAEEAKARAAEARARAKREAWTIAREREEKQREAATEAQAAQERTREEQARQQQVQRQQELQDQQQSQQTFQQMLDLGSRLLK